MMASSAKCIVVLSDSVKLHKALWSDIEVLASLCSQTAGTSPP